MVSFCFGWEPQVARKLPTEILVGDHRFRYSHPSFKNTESPDTCQYLFCGLDASDVFGLESLRTLHHVELDSLTLVEALVALALDRREVYEYIFPGLALDKSKALCCIKPLYGTLFCHFVSFLVELLERLREGLKPTAGQTSLHRIILKVGKVKLIIRTAAPVRSLRKARGSEP